MKKTWHFCINLNEINGFSSVSAHTNISKKYEWEHTCLVETVKTANDWK